MYKLFGFFLDFSSEASDKKTKVLVNVVYYFCSIIISIWLGGKLGFEFSGFNFTVECLLELFADLSIIIPLFLFIMVNSISVIIVHLLAIVFFNFLRVLRYFSYRKTIRKNNLIILRSKDVIDYKDKKVIKGKKFDAYTLKMISDKSNLLKIKNYPKKLPVVIFLVWFIYVQIIRVQFENLYFLWFCILLSLVVTLILFLMGLLLFFTYKISLDEKFLISFELLDKDYFDSIEKSKA
jgi:hypothetical protein